MSPTVSRPSGELIGMVKTLADMKVRMPLKQKSVLRKEYGVKVRVNKFLGTLHYTAGGKALTPGLRFSLKGNRIIVRVYNPGDWELALKKAYDDWVTQSGTIERMSVVPREATSAIGEKARPPRNAEKQKDKGFLGRLTSFFSKSED